MAYYDSIAKRWHETTGYKGGPFKELVLNNILFSKINAIEHRFILEVGAGNGYFIPMLLRHFSGQVPLGITITDKSEMLLAIARRYFRSSGANYQCLDVCKTFPFINDSFHLIIASMILNEVPSYCLKNALAECYRVLKNNSSLLITVLHPDFIESLKKRGVLETSKSGLLTMPGTGSLRLPVVVRSIESYRRCLSEAGFEYEENAAAPSGEVLKLKPGLHNAQGIPVALIYKCTKK